jgi:hypothetical protein
LIALWLHACIQGPEARDLPQQRRRHVPGLRRVGGLLGTAHRDPCVVGRRWAQAGRLPHVCRHCCARWSVVFLLQTVHAACLLVGRMRVGACCTSMQVFTRPRPHVRVRALSQDTRDIRAGCRQLRRRLGGDPRLGEGHGVHLLLPARGRVLL